MSDYCKCRRSKGVRIKCRKRFGVSIVFLFKSAFESTITVKTRTWFHRCFPNTGRCSLFTISILKKQVYIRVAIYSRKAITTKRYVFINFFVLSVYCGDLKIIIRITRTVENLTDGIFTVKDRKWYITVLITATPGYGAGSTPRVPCPITRRKNAM